MQGQNFGCFKNFKYNIRRGRKDIRNRTEQNWKRGDWGARTRKMISRQNPICTNFNLKGETKIENCCARKYVKIA
jgi:hypothetical protein